MMGECTACLIQLEQNRLPDSLTIAEYAFERFSAALLDQARTLGYQPTGSVIRDIDSTQVPVYGSPKDQDVLREWVKNNPSLARLINSEIFYFLATRGSIVLMGLNIQLGGDQKSLILINSMIEQILAFEGIQVINQSAAKPKKPHPFKSKLKNNTD
ncbi:MAG: hypothetical protein AAGD96_04410 [Chloroflexota bacterium]